MATRRLETDVGNFAVLSRVILIVLQAVANCVLPDHDAKVFNPQNQHGENYSILDRAVNLLLGGFRRWDAVYFTHIAEYNYTFENCLAFFPLYPLVVRYISLICWYFFHSFLEFSSIVLIVGVIINCILFKKTAHYLFQLGQQITKNETIAYTAALLFCINPASIFMTAPYTETLYAFLSLLGMLQLQSNNKLKASIYFGLSCATRSNGLLNLGYLGYRIIKDVLVQTKLLKREMMLNVSAFITSVWIYVFIYIIPYCLVVLLGLLPFILYQWYAYHLYCLNDYSLNVPHHLIQYGRQQGLKVYGDPSSAWCNDTIPLAYSYIQSHYWDQGLLKYWQLKQIPNFLLALPVTVLVAGAVAAYVTNNRYTCLSLGLDEKGSLKKDPPPTSVYQLRGVDMLPYILHAVALTTFGWLFIHIQVLTRLLFSSCPVLYWYAASLISDSVPITVQKQINQHNLRSSVVSPVVPNTFLYNRLTIQISSFKQQTLCTKAVLSYFLGYFVIGTILFSNFLPWT